MEDREQLTGQGYSACEEWVLWVWDNPPSLALVGGWSATHGLCMSPVLEFVHLLDMYVLLVESQIIVPYSFYSVH